MDEGGNGKYWEISIIGMKEIWQDVDIAAEKNYFSNNNFCDNPTDEDWEITIILAILR